MTQMANSRVTAIRTSGILEARDDHRILRFSHVFAPNTRIRPGIRSTVSNENLRVVDVIVPCTMLNGLSRQDRWSPVISSERNESQCGSGPGRICKPAGTYWTPEMWVVKRPNSDYRTSVRRGSPNRTFLARSADSTLRVRRPHLSAHHRSRSECRWGFCLGRRTENGAAAAAPFTTAAALALPHAASRRTTSTAPRL